MRDWDWLRPNTINLYQYCGNDPVNAWDPYGLEWWNSWNDFEKTRVFRGMDFGLNAAGTIISNTTGGILPRPVAFTDAGRMGQMAGDIASITGGTAAAATGTSGMIGSGAAMATGVGTIPGAVGLTGSAAMASLGTIAAINGARNFDMGEFLSLMDSCFNGGGNGSVEDSVTPDLVDSSSIRFSQDSIKNEFKDGRSLDSLIDGLKSGEIKPDDVPAVRVFQKDGKTYTLDNRRLYCAQQAGVKINIVPATADEVKNEAWKFTTQNDGVSTRLREPQN